MSFVMSKNVDHDTILWLCLCVCVPYCSAYADWLYPGPDNSNLTFNYKDTVYFTWTSSITHPWMNLWCAPSHTAPQSSTYVYHEQVSTNGTNQQSFDYSEYDNQGICHMQLENLAGTDWANTPTFDLTSNDAVEPQTWGLSALSLLGGAATQSAVTSSSTATTPTSTPPSSTLPTSSPSSTPTPSSSTIASPTSSPSTTPTTAPRTPTPSHPLTPATKAGISIGTIFCALAIIIAILLARNIRSRRKTRAEQKQVANGVPKQVSFPNAAEIGEGRAFSELNGVGRPNELLGVPGAEG